MIEGVYIFELMGGLSSRVVGIVYDNGIPRIALRDSTRHKTLIRSEASKLTVEVIDPDGQSRRYEFSRSDSGARR